MRLEDSGKRVWRHHVSPDDLLYELEMTVDEKDGDHVVDIKVSLEIGRGHWTEEVAVAGFTRTSDGRDVDGEVLSYGDLVDRGERESKPDV